jgi:hypothetical protein
MVWFKNEPIQGSGSGPIFRPIFKGVTNGVKVTDEVDSC